MRGYKNLLKVLWARKSSSIATSCGERH